MSIISDLILFIILPLLLILSISVRLPKASRPAAGHISKMLRHNPLLAWIPGMSIMWLFHMPLVFSMPGLQAAGLQILYPARDAILVFTGLIFWWPVLGPVRSYRLPVFKGILYLFAACITCSSLGLFITFSPSGFYNSYEGVSASSGSPSFLKIYRNFIPSVGRQIAGLIMWLTSGLIYLSVALYLFKKH